MRLSLQARILFRQERSKVSCRLFIHSTKIQPYNMITQILDFIRRPENYDFNTLARQVFAYQFAHNPPYQRFCKMRGRTPDTVVHWQDIPAVPTVAFKELDLSCGPPEKIFRTSGTTRGQEKRGRHLVPDLRLYHESALAHFAACLLPDNRRMPVLALIPSLEARSDSSLTQMTEWVMHAFGAEGNAYFIDPSGVHLDSFVDAIDRAQREGIAVCILAITSALVAFFDYCEAQGCRFTLPGGSRIMDTGGNKGKGRVISRHGFLQSCWKYLKVAGYYCVNEYGMTEMASQFYDNVLYNRFRRSNEPRYKIGPAWTRTLVVDPETLQEVPQGQIGLLQHFDLANAGSVMAVQTEDIGYAVGDGFEITGRMLGAEPRGCALTLDEFLSAQGDREKEPRITE